MKNKHIAFIIAIATFLLFPIVGNAQDLIVKTTGENLKVKVLEVGPDYVKYKVYGELDGPLYYVKKTDILMIKYESGRTEEYFKKEGQQSQKQDYKTIDIPYKNYKELKMMYKPQEYVRSFGDRYNPSGIGVASFFIPGLGECICGEWGRGIGKFVANAALATTGSILITKSYVDENWGLEIALATVCYLGCFFIDIYSIVDAVQIAKVKNMYEQDLRRGNITELNLHPSFDYIKVGNNLEPTFGLTLALKF